MEKKFINKSNLSSLNKYVCKELNLYNNPKNEKKKILNLILGNMKKVYNKLDKNKINTNNYGKVLEIFNKYSLQNTINEIRDNNSKSTSKNTKTENNNSYLSIDRPEQTYQVRNTSYDNTERNVNYNYRPQLGITPQKGNSKYVENVEPNKAMEILIAERNNQVPSKIPPPIPEFSLEPENPSRNIEGFNNLVDNNNFSSTGESKQYKMNGDTYYLSGSNVDSNYSSINFDNNELSKELPTFDESIDVNKKLQMLQNERSKTSTNSDNTTTKPDFTKSIEENKIMMQNNYQEEPRYQRQPPNVQQQQYQRQPPNVQQQQYQRQPPNVQQQHQRQPPNVQQQYQRQPPNVQQQHQRQPPNVQQPPQMQPPNVQQQQYNNLLNNASTPNTYNIIEKLNHHDKDEVIKLLNEYAQNNSNSNLNKQGAVDNKNKQYKKNIEKRNSEVNNYIDELSRKQLDQLNQVQLLQQQLQNHLKNQILNNNQNNVQNSNQIQNNELNNDLISKCKILTGQLEQYKQINYELKNKLDELMNQKDDDNDKKLRLIEVKKNEIKNEVIKLSNKHKDMEDSYNKLVFKEKFINSLISKNKKIIETDKKTVMVNSRLYNNLSKFVYELDESNINKIELISYDFPLISNNINDNNNKLYFKIDDDSVKQEINNSDSDEIPVDDTDDLNYLIIPNGNYDISNLIKKINKLGKSSNLLFSYNKNTNKVTVKNTKHKFTLYNKDDSILNILGFEDDILENKKEYVSKKSYDLRKNKYISIYFTNINNEKSFADVNINTNKMGYYSIDVDNKVDNLEIEIRDDNNKLLDFCNLPFKMELNIIFSNNKLLEDDINYESSDKEDEIEIHSPDIEDNVQLVNQLRNRLNTISTVVQ